MNVDILYDRGCEFVPLEMGPAESVQSFNDRPMYQHVYYGYKQVIYKVRVDKLNVSNSDDIEINFLDPNGVISDDIMELMELGGLLAVRRVQALEGEKIDKNITVKPKNLSDSSHNQ